MLFVNLNAGIGKHQVALADAMYDVLGKDFVFIEFGRYQGYQYGTFKDDTKGVDYYSNRPYILKMYESKESEKKAKELIATADAMRVGGEPLSLTAERIKAGKLTFRSSERLFSGPLWKDIIRYCRFRKIFHQLSTPNHRILCQSSFLANDLRFFGNGYKDRCYKFAYFTQIPQLNIEQAIGNRRKDKLQIVWCARFIELKHPEMPLQLAEKLIVSGRPNFEIRMIGADTTPLWHKKKQEVETKQLQNHVILTGGMANTEVLEQMRQSHVFIFTSDKNEGWGAVLNEAMGAGCACVASNEIGSVPFLLHRKEDGMIFKSCSVDSLFEKVAYLYDNRKSAEQMGRNAYETITTTWSAQQAAKRLVELSESILLGKEKGYVYGPCSKAYPLRYNDLLK